MWTDLFISDELKRVFLTSEQSAFVLKINARCPRPRVTYSFPYATWDSFQKHRYDLFPLRTALLNSCTHFVSEAAAIWGDLNMNDTQREVLGVHLENRRPVNVETARLVENQRYELPPDFREMARVMRERYLESLEYHFGGDHSEGLHDFPCQSEQQTPVFTEQPETPTGYEKTGKTLNADEDLDALFAEIDIVTANR